MNNELAQCKKLNWPYTKHKILLFSVVLFYLANFIVIIPIFPVMFLSPIFV